jgi:hypothetical protein
LGQYDINIKNLTVKGMDFAVNSLRILFGVLGLGDTVWRYVQISDGILEYFADSVSTNTNLSRPFIFDYLELFRKLSHLSYRIGKVLNSREDKQF